MLKLLIVVLMVFFILSASRCDVDEKEKEETKVFAFSNVEANKESISVTKNIEMLKKAHADRSKAKNQANNVSSCGQTCSKSDKFRNEKIITMVGGTPQKPIINNTPDVLKSSLNHRSDAMNPNSKRYNPTIEQSKNGKTARRSSNRAAAMHENQKQLKKTQIYSKNISPTTYVAIQSFVRSLLANCAERKALDMECAKKVATDVGFSSAITAIVANIPFSQLILHLNNIENACYNADEKECVIEITKMASSMGISAVSYAAGLGICGPIIDGILQYYGSRLIDYMSREYVSDGTEAIAETIKDFKETTVGKGLSIAREKVDEKLSEVADKFRQIFKI